MSVPEELPFNTDLEPLYIPEVFPWLVEAPAPSTDRRPWFQLIAGAVAICGAATFLANQTAQNQLNSVDQASCHINYVTSDRYGTYNFGISWRANKVPIRTITFHFLKDSATGQYPYSSLTYDINPVKTNGNLASDVMTDLNNIAEPDYISASATDLRNITINCQGLSTH